MSRDVTRTSLSPTGDEARRASAKAPLIVGGGLLAFGLVLAHLLVSAPHAHSPGIPPEAPALWTSVAPACAELQEQRLRTHAERTAQAADAKHARYPFAARDGVEAVLLYQQAAACFRALDDRPTSHAAATRGRDLARRIERRYQGHQVRLRLALQQDRIEDASREARMLRALLAHLDRDSPYLSWLDQTLRRLERTRR